MDLDLIVSRETIHEGQGLVANTFIDDLVDERCWEFVFGKSVIEIMKVQMRMVPYFLLTGMGLETHDSMRWGG
jgi:hypothetical protein